MSAETPTVEISGTETQERPPDEQLPPPEPKLKPEPAPKPSKADVFKQVDVDVFGGNVKDTPRVEVAKAKAKAGGGKPKPEKKEERKESAPAPQPEPQLSPEAEAELMKECKEQAELGVNFLEKRFLLKPVDELRDVFTPPELERVRLKMALTEEERAPLITNGAKVLRKHVGEISPEWALIVTAGIIYLSRMDIAAEFADEATKRRKAKRGLSEGSANGG